MRAYVRWRLRVYQRLAYNHLPFSVRFARESFDLLRQQVVRANRGAAVVPAVPQAGTSAVVGSNKPAPPRQPTQVRV